jgi:bifunctional non-homologous end joining protein LigD
MEDSVRPDARGAKPSFDRHVFLYAFDLIELDGKDLRREPIEHRKAVLPKLLRGAKLGLQLNEHLAEPGVVVFRHACRLGLEGIIRQRLGSRYVSGRSRDWLKFKNPSALTGSCGTSGKTVMGVYISM